MLSMSASGIAVLAISSTFDSPGDEASEWAIITTPHGAVYVSDCLSDALSATAQTYRYV
jgi:hypothetical protein